MHQIAFGGQAPLGELKRSPRSPSRNMGPTSKGRELGKGGRKENGREEGGGEGKGRELGVGREERVLAPLYVCLR